MESIQITIGQPTKVRPGIFAEVKNVLLQKKLNTTFSIVTLLLSSLLLGYITVHSGFSSGILILIAIVAVPAVYAIIVYPKIGITILLFYSYVFMCIARFGINFPLGTLVDGLEALLIIGFFLKQKYNPDWKIYRNPISAIILIWIGYNLLEFMNPVAESRMAWLYTIRTVAIVMLMYFVFVYHLRDVKIIRYLFKLWIGLSCIAAIYAVKQEYFGFSAVEQRIIDSDPNFTNLLFVGGHWRKFSIFSDPVVFSYNMVSSSILCLSLITGVLAFWKKIVLGVLALFFIITMLYSGTRGAYVLIPAAFALFCILKYNKKILLIGVIVGAVMGLLIVMPPVNSTQYRFQSAFKPSTDESFKARKANQKRIQPYILSHPLGGGLGATGFWGIRFAPNSYLANFPPDSGYVRVAVELGWVGLLLFCTFMFIVLKTGINNYYRIKDRELKSYCLAMTLIVFALNIGNYPQEALVQFPTNIYFYLVIALINITFLLDQKKQKEKLNNL